MELGVKLLIILFVLGGGLDDLGGTRGRLPLVAEASFWDSLPIISQLKSAVQALTGDLAGAKETQENFSKQAPGVSQIRSLIEAANGNPEAAKKTQEQFASNIKEVADSTPVLGHVIGGIHVAVGDREKGLDIIKGASSSAGAVLGGLAGGPAGAIAGAALTDGLITGVDTAINKEFKPFGIVDHVANFDDKNSGEHIDQVLGFLGEFAGGKAGSKNKNKHKNTGGTHPESGPQNHDQTPSRGSVTGADQTKSAGGDGGGGSGVVDKNLGSSGPGGDHLILDLGPPDAFADPVSSMRRPDAFTDPVRSSADSHTSTINDNARLHEVIASHGKMSLEEALALPAEKKLRILQDSVTHLPESYRRLLGVTDFRKINSPDGFYNCYLCTLGGLSDKKITRLAKIWRESQAKIERNENVAQGQAPWRAGTTAPVIRDLFKSTEFPRASITYCLTEAGVQHYLKKKLATLPSGSIYKFGLGFTWAGANAGHIIGGRAWMEGNQLHHFYSDYQVPLDGGLEGRHTVNVPIQSVDHVIVDLGINNYDKIPHASVDLGVPPADNRRSPSLPGCTLMCQNPEKASSVISERLAGVASGDDQGKGSSKYLARKVGKMELLDLKENVNTGKRCHWCMFALFAGSTLGALRDTSPVEPRDLATTGASVQQAVEIYKLLGYPDTRLLFSGNERELYAYLDANLPPENAASTKVVLAYEPQDGAPGEGVNQVLLSAWREANVASIQLLMTDFQFAPNNLRRFKRNLSELEGGVGGGRVLHLIQPKALSGDTRESLERASADIPAAELERGVGCPHKSRRRIIGYVASWSTRPLSVRLASRYTNLIFAFARMDADGSLHLATDTISGQRLLEIIAARESLATRGHRLALSLAIGGWTNSQHFSSVVADASTRKALIGNIAALLSAKGGFDGIDIDWEYPGTGGATEGRAEDRDNYVSFVRELRAQLPAGKLISIAGAAGEEALRGFDIAKLSESLDWIGVMTYDFNGAWDSKWGAYVGPNAPLRHAAPPGYSGKLNAHWAIKQYVCRSKEPSKIVLGLPFYGRFWSKTQAGKDASAYPLYRMAEKVNGKFGGEVSYRDIEDTWFAQASLHVVWSNLTRRAKKHWDERSSTPWALDESTSSVLTYDSAESISAKVKYALEHELGGVMVWSVDQDDDEMTLTQQVGQMCAPRPSGGASSSGPAAVVEMFKCNSLGEERRWWTWTENQTNAGQCGLGAPLYKGFYARCDPDDPGYGCCGRFGYCGSGDEFCNCKECVDYTREPEKLIKEPLKPTRATIAWHVGFNNETLRPGKPRCGGAAPPLANGYLAICNPDDDHGHCCSAAGYCGVGALFCDCAGCKNFRKLSESESSVGARKPEEIRWHVGFDVVKQGEPRCGPSVPKVRDQVALCNPDDDGAHCCSPAGYCGATQDFCKCKDCVDARKV